MLYQKSMSLLVFMLFLFCSYAKAIGYNNFDSNRDQQPETSEYCGETVGPLYLTPLIRAQKFQKAKLLAKVKDDQMTSIAPSYSGFLTVNETCKSNLFFWYFPAKEKPETAPVVLYLEGGPGVSSMKGLFYENGPFIIKNGELSSREYSWHKNHHLIYIDNPVGTGFSFTQNEAGYVRNKFDIGNNLYEAIKQFFTLFSELQSHEFYITGESYGGKYVPTLAYTIYKENQNDYPSINLIGLAIGNGLSDPINQINYGPLLYQLGLIDLLTMVTFNDRIQIVKSLIKGRHFDRALKVFNTIITNNDSLFVNNTGLTTINNYLKEYKIGDDVVKYFQSSMVRDAIHVGNVKFSLISEKVSIFLANDIMDSVQPWIEELLSKYPIFVYSGQLDILVGPVLVENYLMHLKFNKANEFREKKRKIWYVDEKVAGYYRKAGNLTEIVVRNAGHMVPVDQPKWALDMLIRLTYKKGFSPVMD